MKTNRQPFPGMVGFPPPWCSNGHKNFAPSSDLAFRTVFWLVDRKGRVEPELSYGLRYRDLAPLVTYPGDTVCAALAIGFSWTFQGWDHKDLTIFYCHQSPRLIVQSHAAAGFLAGFCTPLSFLWLPGKCFSPCPGHPLDFTGPEMSIFLINLTGLGSTIVFQRCLTAFTLAQVPSEGQ